MQTAPTAETTALPPLCPAQELQEIMRACAEQVAPLRGPSLDMGCWEGRNLPLLPEPRYCFDLRWQVLRQARLRYESLPFHPFAAALADIPLASETFGTVLAWAVMYILGGIEPHRRALAETYRVMRPGGMLFANYRVDGDVTMRYAGEQVDYRTYRITADAPSCQHNHIMSFWRPREIIGTYQGAGFRVLGSLDIELENDDGKHLLLAVVAQRPG